MQHVNDHMDDLFRSAGEHYPLQIGKPDWDKVHHALQKAEEQEKQPPAKSTRLLWLLLLLPLAFICTHYLGPSEMPVSPIPSSSSGGGGALTTDPTVAARPLKTRSSSNERQQRQGAIQLAEKPAAKAVSPAKTALQRIKQSGPSTQLTATSDILPVHGKQEKHLPNKTAQPARHLPEALQLNGLEDYKASHLLALQPAVILDSISRALMLDPLLKRLVPPPSKTTQFQSKGVYAGFLASIDLTSVHMQKTRRPGWQLGVLLGYKFSNKWSIETGLSADRKYYYTEGSYFKKSRTYLPPNSRITEVTGTCTMLEIPLSVRYDLATKPNASWFATGGITSYIMKKEDYDFVYYYGNSGTYATHSKTYRNASTNLFSVLQFSGGYSHKVGMSTSIRIEPYLKLPVTGLGYGKLRFTSMGLTAGMVRKL